MPKTDDSREWDSEDADVNPSEFLHAEFLGDDSELPDDMPPDVYLSSDDVVEESKYSKHEHDFDDSQLPESSPDVSLGDFDSLLASLQAEFEDSGQSFFDESISPSSTDSLPYEEDGPFSEISQEEKAIQPVSMASLGDSCEVSMQSDGVSQFESSFIPDISIESEPDEQLQFDINIGVGLAAPDSAEQLPALPEKSLDLPQLNEIGEVTGSDIISQSQYSPAADTVADIRRIVANEDSSEAIEAARQKLSEIANEEQSFLTESFFDTQESEWPHEQHVPFDGDAIATQHKELDSIVLFNEISHSEGVNIESDSYAFDSDQAAPESIQKRELDVTGDTNYNNAESVYLVDSEDTTATVTDVDGALSSTLSNIDDVYTSGPEESQNGKKLEISGSSSLPSASEQSPQAEPMLEKSMSSRFDVSAQETVSSDLSRLFPFDLTLTARNGGKTIAKNIHVKKETTKEYALPNIFNLPSLIGEIGLDFEPDEGSDDAAAFPSTGIDSGALSGDKSYQRQIGHFLPESPSHTEGQYSSISNIKSLHGENAEDDILQWTAPLLLKRMRFDEDEPVAVDPGVTAIRQDALRAASTFSTTSDATTAEYSKPSTIETHTPLMQSEQVNSFSSADTIVRQSPENDLYEAETLVDDRDLLPHDVDFGYEQEMPAVPQPHAAENDNRGEKLDLDNVSDVLSGLNISESPIADLLSGDDSTDMLSESSIALPSLPENFGREIGMADTQIGPSPLKDLDLASFGDLMPDASEFSPVDTQETLVGMDFSDIGHEPLGSDDAMQPPPPSPLMELLSGPIDPSLLPETEFPDMLSSPGADLQAADWLDTSDDNFPTFSGLNDLENSEVLPEGELADASLQDGELADLFGDNDLHDGRSTAPVVDHALLDSLHIDSPPASLLDGESLAKDSGLNFGINGDVSAEDAPEEELSGLGHGLSVDDLQAAFSADAVDAVADDFSDLLSKTGDGLPDDLFAVSSDEDGADGELGMSSAQGEPIPIKDRLIGLALLGKEFTQQKVIQTWSLLDIRRNWWIYCDGVAAIVITISSAAILSWFLWYR